MKYVNIRWAKTQIVKKLGYFPAYLIPALNSSSIFQSLVKQTLCSYINNPLPNIFKEKLFVFLSRHSGINYLTICHSCTLQSLGLNPAQILALGDINYPQTEADLDVDLHILNHQWLQTENWQEQPKVEYSLLRCCSFIFIDPNQAINCSNILKSLLGSVLYNCLIIFLGYIKLCHQWIINHPEITHQQDPRSQLHLGSLLLSEIKLAEFFTNNSIDSCQQRAISTWVSPNITKSIKQANIAQLKSILIATKTGNWSWNITSNKLSICHRGLAILGLNNFNGSCQSFLQSIHPDERKSIDLAVIKSISLQQDLNLKCRVVKSNGEISQIQIEGKLYYNVQGKVIGLTGCLTDISTSKSNSGVNNFTNYEQQQNVAQHRELEVLLNLVPYHLFVVDVATRTICLINSGLAKSLGLPNPYAAKNLTINECFPPQYACQITWQQQQVINCKQVLHLQEEVTLPDGTHFFDTVITPLYNEEGEITTLLHTCSDIPDLAATQEALSQRTLQLEAANRELESFSYSVSHDLQAPLRVINGFSQVLWDNYQPLLDDHGRHYLQRIQANSKRMSELIDALLQLSRVTRIRMQSAKVNLSEMAKDIIEELRSSEPQRQVEVMITPNLEVKGDPQLLRIALNNLLNNAWKYTSKRSPALIEFTCHSQNQRPFTYLVRDNGAGFDKAYADKLFTAFQRLHSESEFAGTGIGLATVQRIIYRHGGKVWAEGASDQGATFYFSL